MPYIAIESGKLTAEQKKELIERLTATASAITHIPAKEIRKRFAPDIVAKLLELKWWNWTPEKIKNNMAAIQSGDIEALLLNSHVENDSSHYS